jgi:hypothetical protein
MLAVVFILAQSNYSLIVLMLALFFTVVSGVVYINRGFKILYAADNSRNNH